MYNAIVARIHTRPHPDTKKTRIQLGSVLSNTVVVGIDQPDGALGIYFPVDGQLSHDFCVANSLYNEKACTELDVYSQERFGFFDSKRRVRAQAFGGVKSEGFWMPLSCLSYLSPLPGELIASLKEGEQYDTLNGIQFCEKYYTEATKKAIASGKMKAPKPGNRMFPKHVDTSQFRFLPALPKDSVVYITEKLHGTSHRVGVVEQEIPLTRLQKFLEKIFGCRLYDRLYEWVRLDGSRNVVLNDGKTGFYDTHDFRYDATFDVLPRNGEVFYGEIVGYVSGDRPIMPSQDTTKLKDKEFEQRYGKRMAFSYGCQPGECAFYVYKILQFTPDGSPIELSWAQVEKRCRELDLQTVPLLAVHGISDLTSKYQDRGEVLGLEPIDVLKPIVERLMAGSSTLDQTHIREGVVVRIESPNGTQYVKAKSFAFGYLEGYLKEDDTYVDVEETS